jgi:hypothetical protein
MFFEDFHARVKKKTGRNLKYVGVDNSGEYKRPFEIYWY